MNRCYRSALDALLGGTLDLLADPIAVALYGPDAVFSEGHDIIDHLWDQVAVAAEPLDGRAVANRTLTAFDVTFPAVPDGAVVASLVLYRVSDQQLVAWLDQRPDLAPISVIGNGGPVTFAWAHGVVFRL